MVVIFIFPYNPHPSHPDKPPPPSCPIREGLISVHFGSVWLCSGLFGSLAPFRVRWWGRGGVGERGFCKGKEYHYS